jgi:hypothetical protein
MCQADRQALNDPLPNVYPFLFSDSGHPLSEQQAWRWSGLSTAYRNRNENDNSIRAERIGLQIRLCVDALRLLVNSYDLAADQNFDLDKISRPAENKISFSQDKFSLDMSYKTQICLNELYALRDFILYFIAHVAYGGDFKLKQLIELINKDDELNIANLLLPALSQENPIGTIAKMSLYRNVLFHFIGPKSGPLSPSYYFDEIRTDLCYLHRIILPMYDNIDILKQIERRQILNSLENDESEVKRFMQKTNHTDTLEFCFDCLSALLSISQAVESNIPIESASTTIDDSQILCMTIVDAHGVERHFEKDDKGELVEKPAPEFKLDGNDINDDA